MVLTNTTVHERPRRLLGPLLAVAACFLLWPAMLTFHSGDWPSPHQFPPNDPLYKACGPIGAYVAYYAQTYLGDGIYPLMLFVTFVSLAKLVRGRVGAWGERSVGLVLLVVSTAASVHLISSPQMAELPTGHGGVLGFAVGDFLIEHLSKLGTFIFLMAVFVIGSIFATRGWVLELPTAVRRAGSAAGGAVRAARDATTRTAPRVATGSAGSSSDATPSLLRIPARSSPATEVEDDADDTDEDVELEDTPEDGYDGTDPDESEDGDVEDCADETPPSADTADAETPSERPGDKPGGRVPMVVRMARPRTRRQTPTEPYPRRIKDWTLPSLSLLHEGEYGYSAKQERIVREKAMVLERTLQEFRLDAHVVEIDTGPVITMFELKLAPGIKVSQIASLSNDIARALKAPAIRVVAPIPGKNTVGVEVPNVEKEKVRLRDLMLSAGQHAHRMALPLFIGKDAGGAVLVTDLAKAPHMLIAGTTGSGKSVCLNSIIVSLLMLKPPDRVKLILVDPKMVEMSQFKDVPHLMCPIVTDMNRAEKILEWAVTKMDERYEILAEARVRNIAAYNDLGEDELYARFDPASEQERAQIPVRLPYIVIIIDELADLMMTAAKEVEHHLSRLAQKSRAVGVHIVVATQRPEVKVVTGLIKSNLPCRIAFRVASRMDSRIVLDQNGGEVLMGQGDMLFLPPGSHKLIRAQGTFLEDAEVAAVLEELAERGRPEFHPELVGIKASDQASLALRDPLFDNAVAIVLQSKRGSVSLLQRRLTIGYSRASRLIDQMSDAGIVGDYKGSQAREVLITPAEWKQIQSQVDDDLEAGYEADEDDDAPEDSDPAHLPFTPDA